MQMRQLGRRPVKSERRSLGTGATHREGVRGGSVTEWHENVGFVHSSCTVHLVSSGMGRAIRIRKSRNPVLSVKLVAMQQRSGWQVPLPMQLRCRARRI